jgi:hypothetical protein
MSAADVLDGGIAVLKTAPRTILAVAAVFVVPVQLATSWLNRDVIGEQSAAELLNPNAFSVATSTAAPAALWFSAVATSLVLVLVCGAVTRVVAAWYSGGDASTADALRTVGRHWWALVASWLLVHIVEALAAVALVAPALFAMAMFLVTAPVVVAERTGPVTAMRRSWRLVKPRFGATLGCALLIAVVDGVLQVALTGVGLVFTGFDWAWVPQAVLQSGAAIVTTPFVAAATALVYIDLRVRVEGLDIELGAREHLPVAG